MRLAVVCTIPGDANGTQRVGVKGALDCTLFVEGGKAVSCQL